MELNKIYNEDCLVGLKRLPDKCIDFVITSPPYNKGETKNSGKLGKSIQYSNYKDNIDECEYQLNQIQVLDEIFRVLKDDGHLFYNHKNRYINGCQVSPLQWICKTNFIVRQEIVWDRHLTGNLRGWRFWQVDERIYWMQKPNAIRKEIPISIASLSNIWRINPSHKKDTQHPCAYPIELVERCLSIEENLNDKIVLDPYMGSGTTAIASIKHKCKYIGFELSNEYIEKAKQRIFKAQQQLTLF